MRFVRSAFAVLALAFFATPLALHAAGAKPEQFENRRLAEAPAASQGWNAFAQATRFLVDHMPLRAQAVRANTRIWTDVFHADPRYAGETELADDGALPFAGSIDDDGDVGSGQARGSVPGPASAKTGRDGWLYLPEEFTSACDKSVSDALALRRWASLVRAVRAEGPDAAMFIAPFKASVYPEHLPDKYLADDCALPAKERFWSLLSKEGPRLGLDSLRDDMLALKSNVGDGLFERKDTHWSTFGALVYIRAVLRKLGGGVTLEPSEIIDNGMVSYRGDLTFVGGRPEADERHDYGIERRPDAPRVPGRTLIVGDSFTYKFTRLLKPYFEDLRVVSWYNSDENIVGAIQRADKVIVEATEILFKVQAADDQRVLKITRMLRRAHQR